MPLLIVVNLPSVISSPKIEVLNYTMREILPMIDKISTNNTDTEVKKACLQFSNVHKWMHTKPKKLSEFV